jgi:dinuclear metal center YbgI/SA1388 family protein
MKVSDLVGAMETIAPTRFAAAWDNVGLLVGDPQGPLHKVLLTIDCTLAVVGEARAGGFDAVVAYHPPIFDAQKRFVAGSAAYEAARAGLAVFSPHTALDVAAGGTNDVLADLLGMTERTPLRAAAATARDAELKLVTFVPASHVEVVSQAVFSAGAGRIGDYSSCSFRMAGSGTFLGGEGTHPAVGQAGRLEEVEELRLETIVPAGRLEGVVHALRAAHPYEEPAFDLVPLASAPGARGFGCVGAVGPATVGQLVDRVKSGLGVDRVLLAGGSDREITRAAVCAGSGGDLVSDAIAARATLLLTGEVRHHDALRATEAGMAVVCTRHSTSERAALVGLETRLRELLPGIDVRRSDEDRDPFRFA